MSLVKILVDSVKKKKRKKKEKKRNLSLGDIRCMGGHEWAATLKFQIGRKFHATLYQAKTNIHERGKIASE